jgi:ubiquinone/menaquinone biosynthesis C-methylase UbiE
MRRWWGVRPRRPLGCEVTGFDASAALLAIVRERLPQSQFVHGDLEQLPFATGHFHAALVANSVIFAEDIRAGIGIRKAMT